MKKAIVGSEIILKEGADAVRGDEGVGVIKAILRYSRVDCFKVKYYTDYAIQFKKDWCHYRRTEFKVI